MENQYISFICTDGSEYINLFQILHKAFAQHQTPEIKFLRNRIQIWIFLCPVIRDTKCRKVKSQCTYLICSLCSHKRRYQTTLTSTKNNHVIRIHLFHSVNKVKYGKKIGFLRRNGHVRGISRALGTYGTTTEIICICNISILCKILTFVHKICMYTVIAMTQNNGRMFSFSYRSIKLTIDAIVSVVDD